MFARSIAALVLLAGVLPQEANAQAGPVCSTLQQNLNVRRVMDDLYYWRSESPLPDPTLYSTPHAYLEAIRLRPLDSTFSYITTQEANEALFQRSEFVGLGFSSTWQTSQLRITQVYPGSPAAAAGLRRGDTITRIDTKPVDGPTGTDAGTAPAPLAPGQSVSLSILRDGQESVHFLEKATVVIPTVQNVAVIAVAGKKVGHLFLRNFVAPTEAKLDEAFLRLRSERTTHLVLDLRYNGGGLVSVARHLGGLIGGNLTAGQIFARYNHNRRNASLDRVLRFEAPPQSLQLRKVIILTSRASASASEMLINALRPFLPVVQVGQRTFGKPVGQYAITFCGLVLAPVAFAVQNAESRGGYFSGLAPDCDAPDDLEHALGDPRELMLAAALHYVAYDQCPSATPPLNGTNAIRPPETPRSPWQVVLGAQ